MHEPLSVGIASDGIIVSFAEGTICYYPASFLLDHANDNCNQVFLSFDPSAHPSIDGQQEQHFSASGALIFTDQVDGEVTPVTIAGDWK